MTRYRTLAGLASLVVVVATMVLLVDVAFSRVPVLLFHSGQWKTIKTFTGVGSATTTAFEVPQRWQLVWACNPSSTENSFYNVIVQVQSSTGVFVDFGAVNAICTAVHHSGIREESSSMLYPLPLPEVYLRVISEGLWRIDIQVPQSEQPALSQDLPPLFFFSCFSLGSGFTCSAPRKASSNESSYMLSFLSSLELLLLISHGVPSFSIMVFHHARYLVPALITQSQVRLALLQSCLAWSS